MSPHAYSFPRTRGFSRWLWRGDPDAPLVGEVYTISHHARDVRLSSARPRDAELRITFLRVEEDGRAVILAEGTGETLAAGVGEAFLGEPRGIYTGGLFGRSGLILKSSDYAHQAVVLERHWAEHADR